MTAGDAVLARAADVARRFAVDGPIRGASAHRGGHIHESFVVAAARRRYLLQRLNTHVFPDPERVMANLVAVTTHLARALPPRRAGDSDRRTVTVIPMREGGVLARDETGACWRMFLYIERTVSHETARDAADAESAARAFGRFQRALADYCGPLLREPIAGFHDTRQRLAALERARDADACGRADSARPELAFAERHRELAETLIDAELTAHAIARIAHGDAKIANVLFDEATGEALCVVDLDTVMPGLSLTDFGDLVRSMVSPAAEDEPDPARVRAEPERFAAIVRGYLNGVGGLLLESERRLLPLAAETIVYEQGLRFLTDHLDGDQYYPIRHRAHNLHRCRAQFALLASLEQQRTAFRHVVDAT